MCTCTVSCTSLTRLLQSSLRISPPLPFLPIGGITRDSLNGTGSHLDQAQSTLTAVTSTPGSIPKQWPGASTWPSWNLPDSPEDPFSIEREARLHKQAAGELIGLALHSCVLVVVFWLQVIFDVFWLLCLWFG